MKHFVFALSLCVLCSCTIRPTLTATTPTGAKLKLTLGGTFAAEADEVIAEVEAPGPYHLRYAAKREDSTRVPIAGFQAIVARALGLAAAKSTDLKTTTDGAVLLKATKDPNVTPPLPLDPNKAPDLPFDPNLP